VKIAVMGPLDLAVMGPLDPAVIWVAAENCFAENCLKIAVIGTLKIAFNISDLRPWNFSWNCYGTL
ncbi:hypothetical protein U1Q18_010254, partial [Sarracenia purpurea var. burkii]